MTQIAVINSCSTLKNVDVAFLVEAVSNQLVEFCKAWSLDPWAISFYSSAVGLPADDVFLFEYVDKLDVESALAFHSVDVLGRPYGRMLPPSDPLDATDLSHEVLETRGDEGCDKWMRMPSGEECAVEVCDPVQGDGCEYTAATTVLGESRQIRLSDYVLPAFFDSTNEVGPYDRQGKVKAPFQIAPGGYEAQIDITGNEHDVFARLGSHADVKAKLKDPGSRLSRRMSGRK